MGIFNQKNQWKHSDPKIRLKAVKKSEGKLNDESLENLMMTIVDPNEEVRLAVIDVLEKQLTVLSLDAYIHNNIDNISLFKNILNSINALFSSRIELDKSSKVRKKAAQALYGIWLNPIEYDEVYDRLFDVSIAKKSLIYLTKAKKNDNDQEVRAAAECAIDKIREYFMCRSMEEFAEISEIY